MASRSASNRRSCGRLETWAISSCFASRPIAAAASTTDLRVRGKPRQPSGKNVVEGRRQIGIGAMTHELLDEERIAVGSSEDALDDLRSRTRAGDAGQLISHLCIREGRQIERA